jgi:hypothetical protein
MAASGYCGSLVLAARRRRWLMTDGDWGVGVVSPFVYLIVHSEEMGRQPSPSPKLSDSVPQ